MKILLTGASGNIGMSTLQELLRQGHQVCCLVYRRKAFERTIRHFTGGVELVSGDILPFAHKDVISRCVDRAGKLPSE